jgi:hypothetical protein
LIDFNKARASKLHEEAQRLDDEGHIDEAILKYREAIECDPLKPESHYNLGLIYKYAGEWQKSFECNKAANALDPDDEAARWNLAIAATALRNWDAARKSWRENGIALPGTGPIEADFGITPVRLNPDHKAEVVWARRIDPVRARIESVPQPESGFRYGDVVLHDGAAVGYRKIGEREYPVFNVLELFEQSDYATYVAVVSAATQADADKLDEAFSAAGCAFEDWTQNFRILCRQCSEGTPHEHPNEASEDKWRSERQLGIAARNAADIRPIFANWQLLGGGELLSLERADNRFR